MPSIGPATDVSAAPPRVDVPAPGEPASGDTSTFATALDAAHGEIASHTAPAQRADDRASRSTQDDDGREARGRRDDDAKGAKASTETATAPPTSRSRIRPHKAPTASRGHGSEVHATGAVHVVKTDAAPDTPASKVTGDAAAQAASAAAKPAGSADGPLVEAKTPAGDAAAAAPVAGVLAAAGRARRTSVADASKAVQPTVAAPAAKIAEHVDSVDDATTDVQKVGVPGGAPETQKAAGEAQAPADAAARPPQAAHDGMPAGKTSLPAAKASGQERPASATSSLVRSADDSARTAAANEETAHDATRDATRAPVTRPVPTQPRTEDGSAKTRDADTAATAGQSGPRATTAVAPAEQKSGSRANVDVANGRRAAAHHHPGTTAGDATDGDAFEATVADATDAATKAPSAGSTASDTKGTPQPAVASASAARLQATQDAAATADSGGASGAHPGRDQAATAAATAEMRADASTQAPADTTHAAAPRGDTTVAASWAERVVESVRVATLRGGGEMRLRLEPAGLGNIDVRISLGHDGVRASIVAEHDTTRALLRNEQHLLHAALERSDMRLAGFSVDIGSGGSHDAFADVEHQARSSGGAGAEQAPDTPENVAPEMIVMNAPTASGRLSVRV